MPPITKTIVEKENQLTIQLHIKITLMSDKKNVFVYANLDSKRNQSILSNEAWEVLGKLILTLVGLKDTKCL